MRTDKELALYKFDELLKTLITLSSPAERQIEICGIGCPGDEMANDFDSYYTHCRKLYAEQGLMAPTQFEAMDDLDRYLESRSGQNYSGFWEDTASLFSHPDWEEIRSLARSCLRSLGKSHLDLEVFHETEETQGRNGTTLLIQRTKTGLKQSQGTQPEDPAVTKKTSRRRCQT